MGIERIVNEMGLKRFALGVGIGMAAGLLLRSRMNTDTISPEKALRNVKQHVQSKMSINGSWIHMIPENVEKNNLEYTVYRGGITTLVDDTPIQYDFLVDAKSGTILELTK